MPGSCDVIQLPSTVNYLLDGVSKIYNWTLMRPLIFPSMQKFQNNKIFNKSFFKIKHILPFTVLSFHL